MRRTNKLPYGCGVEMTCSQWLEWVENRRHGGAQTAAEPADSEWPVYRHDHAGTGYSPLTGINRDNVARMAEVWPSSAAAPV